MQAIHASTMSMMHENMSDKLQPAPLIHVCLQLSLNEFAALTLSEFQNLLGAETQARCQGLLFYHSPSQLYAE